MKRIAVILGALALIYGLALAGFYAQMRRNPGDFNQFMAKLPPWVMMVAPFQPLWAHARAGVLAAGDAAPDFELGDPAHSTRVRLSSHRGVRPVMLVFGSYT